MGLERRRSRTYYYQKHRLNGHVVSEYLGKGDLARFPGLTAAESRLERLERARRIQAERDERASEDAILDQFEASLRSLVQAYLLTHGYHIHKGQWRRNYHKKK